MVFNTQVEGLTASWEVETDEHEEDAFGSKMSATAKESKSVEEHAGDRAPSDGCEVLRSGVAELLALQAIPVQAASSSDTDPARLGNAYIASLRDNSSLHVSIADQVVSAYDKKDEYSIFALFFTATLKDRLRKWTSEVLVAGGYTKITEREFNAYLGLEIAMSICPMNEIAEF
ncbi:unnamed protein product [Phytophthora fragariaefolia]|uniref:Unnamed protein product n=1 Tax=Phytophthora fragariaefolia TaxID=1490495 RepID=A0A9W6Y1W3_9STRA|nr:unnamed protein product [Phytophthora fragariaefolia]